jgi:hypothetical protein
MSRLDKPSTLAQTVASVVSQLSVVSPERLRTSVGDLIVTRSRILPMSRVM